MKIITDRMTTVIQLAGILILGFFLSNPSAFGRIGETPEECDKRYGEPVEKFIPPPEGKVYHKAGFKIIVAFSEAKNVGFSEAKNSTNSYASTIMYSKIETNWMGTNKPLSDHEVTTFLKANSRGGKWQRKDPMEKVWNGDVKGMAKDEAIKESLEKHSWETDKLMAYYDKSEHFLFIGDKKWGRSDSSKQDLSGF